MSRQQITGIERHFAADEFIVSKTDAKGFITYVNDVFLRIADYRVEEVVGKPHNLIRHSWMPRCIFKLLWERIQSGEEILAYVVNRTKYGDHYWVFAHVTPSYGEDGKILGYHSNRRVPSSTALKVIQPLYKTLREIEDTASTPKQGVQLSMQEVNKWVTEKGMSYDALIHTL